jgi:hypothetical protein
MRALRPRGGDELVSEAITTGAEKAAYKRRQAAERQERLEQIARWQAEGRLTIRQADPGELPPPANRSERQGRRLFEGRLIGRLP